MAGKIRSQISILNWSLSNIKIQNQLKSNTYDYDENDQSSIEGTYNKRINNLNK